MNLHIFIPVENHLVCKPNIVATLDDPEPAFPSTDEFSKIKINYTSSSLSLHINRRIANVV